MFRTATMSDSYSTSTRQSGFFGKLVLFLLFITGIVLLLVLLNYNQTNLPQMWMTVFAAASIGLASGLGSRVLFYERPGFTRFSMALIALPLGLFGLGFFTNWKMGIGPLEPWLAGIIDLGQLAQLGGGLLVCILGLRAWWNPTANYEEVVSQVHRSSRRREQARTSSSVQLPRFSFPHFNPPRFQVPESWSLRSKGNGRLKLAHRKKSRARDRLAPPVEKLMVSRPEQPVRPRRRKGLRRKPELQLSVYEEHRCPYCLEDVKRNDPRGVKECDICHTLHHADCWNVTGMCQVPHLNSLNP